MVWYRSGLLLPLHYVKNIFRGKNRLVEYEIDRDR